MTGFLFSFIAVLLAGIGGRDQVTVATLALRHAGRAGLLAVSLAVSAGTAAFAAWAASVIAPELAGSERMFFAALALGFAGGESLLLSPGRKPEEPTLSLGAAAIVLIAHQIADAARFLIFAIALATQAPLPAGMGGAIGGAVMLGSAWAAPELFDWHRLRPVRRGLGAALLLLAVFIGLRSLGRM